MTPTMFVGCCVSDAIRRGAFKDDPDVLLRAAEYLNNPPALGKVKKHDGRKKITFLRSQYVKRHKDG